LESFAVLISSLGIIIVTLTSTLVLLKISRLIDKISKTLPLIKDQIPISGSDDSKISKEKKTKGKPIRNVDCPKCQKKIPIYGSGVHTCECGYKFNVQERSK